MKYSVHVTDEHGITKDYNMSIKPVDIIKSEATQDSPITDPPTEEQDKISDHNCKIESDPQMCLEMSRIEYEHSFRVSEKMDNKTYILLTVCGFLFVLLTTAISNITDIEVCKPFLSIWVGLYDLLLVIVIPCTIVLLGLLIYSLSGITLQRYDSNLTLEMNLTNTDATTVARFAIMEYEIAKKENNDKIQKRFKNLNRSVYLLIAVAILLIGLAITASFAKEDTSKYREVRVQNSYKSYEEIVNEIEWSKAYLKEQYPERFMDSSEAKDNQTDEVTNNDELPEQSNEPRGNDMEKDK